MATVSGETCLRTLGITLRSRSPTSNISLGLGAIASLVNSAVSPQQGERKLRTLYAKGENVSQALISIHNLLGWEAIASVLKYTNSANR